MKNDVLVDVPATISLTTLSVVTIPPLQASKQPLLPLLGIIGDFLNLLNRPLRPQSRSLLSLFPAWWSSLSLVYLVGFHPWSGLFLPLELRCSPSKGSFVPGNRLAPCYLFFKLFAFRPASPYSSFYISDPSPEVARRKPFLRYSRNRLLAK